MSENSPVRITLEGRTALVTGGGSGLGFAFAATLARCGADVIVCGRRRDLLERSAERLREFGTKIDSLELDVTDEASVSAAFSQLDGLDSVPDILINNAGLSRPGAALNIDMADWDAVMATNLRGAFVMSRALARRLIDRGRPGTIVNVCSVLGRAPQKGVSPYAVSKAGLLHLTRLLALEWARHGIRVNALVPGYFRTDITDAYLETAAGESLRSRIPQRRIGDLDELAHPLLLLVGDESGYVTGAEIVVDGGLSINPL